MEDAFVEDGAQSRKEREEKRMQPARETKS